MKLKEMRIIAMRPQQKSLYQNKHLPMRRGLGRPAAMALTLLLTLVTTFACAQGPNNTGTYYRDANGKSGADLKTALGKIINKHTNIGYSGLWNAYKTTDTRADGYVRDWYSNTTKYRHGTDQAGQYSKEGDCYNREHSVPQSWFSEASPMKADVVHVFPTDGYVNNRRGNYPFGEVGSVTYQSNNGYSKLGSCKTAGYSGTVFEPNDEIKGDIARIYFYMATCYEDVISNWSGGVFGQGKYPGMAKWTLDMMLRWSQLDPVDDVEKARNDAVQRVQGNRNPYVDYPGLEQYVWGTKTAQHFAYDDYEGEGPGAVVTPTVAQPTFTPNGGTFTGSVNVSITTTTDGATIYYTTNGVDASGNSMVYNGMITLTETTTVKAIAMKDGVKSYQSTATFTVRDDSGEEHPADGTIMLNSQFFGVSYNGSINKSDSQDLVGTQDGVTVTYALGANGANRYCNYQQIRLYQGNTLTFSVADGNLTNIEFELATSTSKTLNANSGRINDLVWQGNAKQVVFSVNEGSGNMQLTKAKVTVDGATAIVDLSTSTTRDNRSYNLNGQPMPTTKAKGIYIKNGKKVVGK